MIAPSPCPREKRWICRFPSSPWHVDKVYVFENLNNWIRIILLFSGYVKHKTVKDAYISVFYILVDLGRIELPTRQCECRVIPLYYRPLSWIRYTGYNNAFPYQSFISRISRKGKASIGIPLRQLADDAGSRNLASIRYFWIPARRPGWQRKSILWLIV